MGQSPKLTIHKDPLSAVVDISVLLLFSDVWHLTTYFLCVGFRYSISSYEIAYQK